MTGFRSEPRYDARMQGPCLWVRPCVVAVRILRAPDRAVLEHTPPVATSPGHSSGSPVRWVRPSAFLFGQWLDDRLCRANKLVGR